jgi:spore maturation protein CgeB
MIKLLYIGSLNQQSNSYRRFVALSQLGLKTMGIDTDSFIYKGPFVKFHHHLNIGPGIRRLNEKVIASIRSMNPDVLYVDNKPFLTSATLKLAKKIVPGLKIVNVITDDPFGKYGNSWRLCKSTAPYYDIHFVQRIVNVDELKQCGANQVEICYRSFDSELHRPFKLSPEESNYFHAQVGFIGTHEVQREECIAYLITNGIPVKVVGNDWPGCKNWQIIKPHYKGPSVYGEEYIKHINGMDIALHFLRHANRDEQDSRTFEIPACGVFMLAERSEAHEKLFLENKEAAFFSDCEELLVKVKYFIQHKEERERIAQSGLSRVLSSGDSHQGRLRHIIEKIMSLPNYRWIVGNHDYPLEELLGLPQSLLVPLENDYN